MYARRETTWIGFQEAQKTINNLKQEVEIAEKKLLNVKKSFNERTIFKPLPKSKEYEPSSKSPEEKGKKQPVHFKKETVPTQPKLANVFSEEKTVPKELFTASEEEPNFLPSKLPHTELLDFKKSLVKSSFDNSLTRFSSTDSFSSSGVKQSSSEGTSSLIERTYRVADLSSKKYETKATETISEKSSTYVSNDKVTEMPSIEKSVLLNCGDIGMEWRPVLSTNKKAFVLHSKSRPDGLQKLRYIIEQQKKKQEQYQIELERNLSLNFDQGHLQNFTPVEDITLDDKIAQVPVRKSCLVKSLPVYKGFSAPSSKLPVRTRWRKQRNKHTIAQSSSSKKNDVNSPKRIKTVVKCESDFVSASYWKSVEKQSLLNKKEKVDQAIDDDHLELSSNKEFLKDGIPENKDENDEKQGENTSSKSSFESTKSAAKENKLLSDKESSGSDVEDVRNESFSHKADLEAELLNISQTTFNDNGSSKENKKPFKSKSLKRKAKIPPDPKVTSPKIRHYDVAKVRDYIKKKKEERKKRHQEEYKKRVIEAQRKKESLEKLYEYHKQNNKPTVKGKPLSPIKIFQKKDIHKREHENQNISSISKKKDVSKYFNFQKQSSTEQKEILKPGQKNDEESLLESNVTETLSKNQIKNIENVLIDISIPNVSQVPEQSLVPEKQLKNKKKSVELSASNENEIKRRKKVTDLKLHNKVSLDSPVQESNMNKYTELNLSPPKTEKEEARNVKESFHISDILKSFSSVSTPSEISHIVGIDARILEVMRPTKPHNTEMKTKKSSELKDLIQSINVMTKPFEPLIRTRKWVEDSPHPPLLKRMIKKESVVLKEEHSEVPEKKLDFQKSSESAIKNSSFKEQISGIGDVSQLYARILGKESATKPVHSILNEPMFADNFAHSQNNETEDDLIEGTLDSAEIEKYKNEENFVTSYCADKIDSPDSPKFSDLQKINTAPDPFNLINTWNRKPLGLSNHDRKIKDASSTEKEDVPSKSAKTDVSFEEMYKNLLDITHKDSEIKSLEPDVSGVILSSFPNEDTELSSIVESTKTSISKKDVLNESVSGMSNENSVSLVEDFPSASSASSHTSSNKSKHSYSKVSAVEPRGSEKSCVQKKDAEKILEPLDSNQVSSIKKNLIESFSEESVIHEQLQKSNSVVDPSSVSDILLSGTINSEYSLDIEMQSFREHDEESIKEVPQDKASASGYSVSEVISVVENSKGFKSSTDNLQSDKTSVPKSAIHSSADEKSISEEKLSSKTLSNESDELDSKLSSAAKNSHLSRSPEKDSEHSILLLKNDQLQSIPSGSQNSVTIDFTQPLRLTLSNGESVESDIMQENQYLHTQVVTRVASEAAAAAATSAVIAVFETQKALLAEKNIFGVLSSFGRSSNTKRTQYSSDFESSPAPKSSSRSSQSSAVESKDTKSIPDQISKETVDEVSAKSESVEEKIIVMDENAAFNSSPKTEESAASVHSQLISEEKISNQKRKPQRNKRKISGNISSPSPASLSDNESISSETIMSSHSNISLQSESVVSEDSFAQLTLDIVRRMTYEEEQRAKNQLSLLQLQEKTIVENARAEMLLLESFKKKLREKGADRKVSAIKKRQKELIMRLRQERAQLQCMQEAYRSICEKHRSLIEDKKKLLKEPSSLAFQLIRDDKPYPSKYSETRPKEYSKATSSSTPTIASDNDIKTMVDEESVSEVPEMLKGLASNSSQESVVETQISEPLKTSNSSQNKSQRNSPNLSFSPLNPAQSNSNPSLHSHNSLETALQGLKKLEASKRHLTKREQRILQRRKQVENLLQWQMKLDSEEMAVRELEQKILDLVDHSKKRAKYYISSSGSTNPDVDKKKESVYESISEGMPDMTNKLQEKSASLRSSSENKTSQTPSDESIPTHMPENDLEGSGTGSEKESIPQVSSVTHSSKSLPEEIKSESKGSSVQTIEATENGSHIDDVISEEILYQGSPSLNKSSSSEIYSESFESSEKTGKQSPSVLSTSPLKNSSPSSSKIKKSGGLGIRLPLVPRNMRRHDSSGSDDSYTISQSETASDQSDIEVRIHALTEELKRRKAEAEKLKRKKYREQLKEKELSLQKQLEAYNQFISQTKSEIEHQLESAVSPPQAGDLVLKPRIKWPRPEQVVDSRRVRKQPTFSPDNFSPERKSELINGNTENSIASVSNDRGKLVKKLFPDATPKLEESSNKELSEKSTSDSKDVSEALSANISSEIHEISEIEQLKSASSEVSSDIKELSDVHENSSIQLQLDESKSSYSDEKKPSTVSSLEESKNSPDTAESKSQTDTFITESGSSKSTDPTTPKQSEDNSSSNKTVSSEDEHSTKIAKSFSSDDNQRSDVHLSKDVSEDSNSSEEIVSEVQSIINSSPTAEELEDENSSKTSKCNSAQGCELSAKSKIAAENEILDENVLKIEQFDRSAQLEKEQSKVESGDKLTISSPLTGQNKLLLSESQITNIVTILSTTLIDDTLQTFICVYNQKRKLQNILEDQTVKSKSTKTKETKDETANSVSISLFDTFLKDAVDSILRILKQSEGNSKEKLLLSLPETKTNNNNLLSSLGISSGSVNNILAETESSKEYQSNSICHLQDINDNEILNKPAFWNVDNLITSERDQQIQQLEQQLVFQQYSYFYRKIPNKPPPPYTPPASNASSVSSFEFPFVKEKPIEKSSVKDVTKHIDEVVDGAIEVLMCGKEQGLSISEIVYHAFDNMAVKLGFTMPHQNFFMDLVFDLTKEIILEHFSETKETPQPWLRPRKLTPKPLITSKESMSELVKKEVKKALRLDTDLSNQNRKKQLSWSSLKLGRKKRDFVDTILISELKEEEPDWVNYDQDEVTVKFQIADSIFNILINDTVNLYKELQLKTNR